MGKDLWSINLIWGNIVDVTKSDIKMETKLNKITHLSKQDSQMKFSKLMPHFTEANLLSCFNELNGKKAVGIDGKTKAAYAEDLTHNIQNLVRRMKSFSYHPEPVSLITLSTAFPPNSDQVI